MRQNAFDKISLKYQSNVLPVCCTQKMKECISICESFYIIFFTKIFVFFKHKYEYKSIFWIRVGKADQCGVSSCVKWHLSYLANGSSDRKNNNTSVLHHNLQKLNNQIRNYALSYGIYSHQKKIIYKMQLVYKYTLLYNR